MASKSKSPMGVDKSATPLWMRVVIIIVALSFVVMLVPVVFAGLGRTGGGASSDSTDTTLFESEYQPRVDAALAAVQTDPNNPDVIAQVGHAYYEWAAEVFQSGQQSASVPLWKNAVSYYDKVLVIVPDDDVVLGNKAFALYYAADVGAAPALDAFIAAAADNAELSAQVENAQQMLGQLASAEGSATTTP